MLTGTVGQNPAPEVQWFSPPPPMKILSHQLFGVLIQHISWESSTLLQARRAGRVGGGGNSWVASTSSQAKNGVWWHIMIAGLF